MHKNQVNSSRSSPNPPVELISRMVRTFRAAPRRYRFRPQGRSGRTQYPGSAVNPFYEVTMMSTPERTEGTKTLPKPIAVAPEQL